MGSCNRNTGLCECFNGFYGSACQKITCGNACNGHGVCASTSHLHDFYLPSSTIGNYNQWDGNHTYSCVCDSGYTGVGCTMRMCPKGDDPLTPFTDFRTIEFTTAATFGEINGYIKFIFNGELLSFDVHIDSDASPTLQHKPALYISPEVPVKLLVPQLGFDPPT